MPKKLLTFLIIGGLLTIALLTRLYLAQTATFPGSGDYAFYYSVAKNLDAGRPFQIDYIWHYLSKPATITHSSLEYWAPLTSIIIFFSFQILGQSTTAALVPAVLANVLLSVLTYFLSSYYTQSSFVRWAAAALVLFLPTLFRFSLTTDSVIYYALFINCSLLFILKGMADNPLFFLVAAFFAALSHLTRLDGFLVIAVLFISIQVSRWSNKSKIAYLTFSAVLYLLLLSPWLITNQNAFGNPLPTAPSKVFWLQKYDDLFAYSKTPSFERYLEWGIGNILQSKIQALIRNLINLLQHLGLILTILLLLTATHHVRKIVKSSTQITKLTNHLPPILYLIILLTVQTTFGTVTSAGSFYRSSHAIIPYLLIISLNHLYRSAANLVAHLIPVTRFGKWLYTPQLLFLLITFLLGVYFFVQSGRTARTLIQTNNNVVTEYAALSNVITSHLDKQANPPVLMAAFPWEVNLATGHQIIVIPRDGLDSLFQAAHDYNADFLLLPAPSAYLTRVYEDTVSIPGLEFITGVPGTRMKLYQFIP